MNFISAMHTHTYLALFFIILFMLIFYILRITLTRDVLRATRETTGRDDGKHEIYDVFEECVLWCDGGQTSASLYEQADDDYFGV